jgi:hypothetical protein
MTAQALNQSLLESLLEVVLDSWDRNNTILLIRLHALPEGGLEPRGMACSPSPSCSPSGVTEGARAPREETDSLAREP